MNMNGLKHYSGRDILAQLNSYGTGTGGRLSKDKNSKDKRPLHNGAPRRERGRREVDKTCKADTFSCHRRGHSMRDRSNTSRAIFHMRRETLVSTIMALVDRCE